jgi:uncharacterized membrane protein
MIDFKYLKIKDWWHALFEYAIVAKGFIGIWETISGFLILFISKAEFNSLFSSLARNELLEDPHDFFINFIAQNLQTLSLDTKIFIAIFILIHGILDIFLVVQLYRNKIWAYLLAIAVMLIFIGYQIYRIVLYHSLILIVITIFDLLLVGLIWHEYKHQKNLMKS